MSSWRISREWADDNRRDTSVGIKPRSVAMVDGERGICSKYNSTKDRAELGIILWVIITKSFLKN
jgi:hypothetical protein